MVQSRIVWYELLKRHRRPFLQFLREGDRRREASIVLADRLTTFLIQSIRTTDDAAAFWSAVPSVLERCDEQETYEKPFAPEAYAWIHVLDRYVRTWVALEYMVGRACLPVARRGVNVLDVGTGPGPSALAITDFYRTLSSYAQSVGEELLIQPCNITTVEMSWENNAFRSRFREVTLIPISEHWTLTDFRHVDPRAQRANLRDQLLAETDWNPLTGEEEPAYGPVTADWDSQGLFRYRLVTLCNFLTSHTLMQSVRANLVATLSDLQPGSIVLQIGGTGGHYPHLYEDLDTVASEAGLRLRAADVRVRSTAADTAIILSMVRTVAQHVERLAPMGPEVPTNVHKAVDSGDRWGSTSSVRIYRRNRHHVRIRRRPLLGDGDRKQ